MRNYWHTLLAAVVLLGSIVFTTLNSGASYTFTSMPKAAVYQNNKLLGYTPLSTPLQSGTHSILFEAAGYESQLLSIKAPTASKSVDVKLTPKSEGEIKITSNPSGATIFLDNQYLGLTPYHAVLPQGSYAIRLELHNYRPRNARVRAIGNSTTIADFELENLVLPILKDAIKSDPKDIIKQLELAHYYMLLKKPRLAATHYNAARSIMEKTNPDWLIKHKYKKMVGDDSKIPRIGWALRSEMKRLQNKKPKKSRKR